MVGSKQKELQLTRQEAEIFRINAYSNLIMNIPNLLNTFLICTAIVIVVYFIAGSKTELITNIIIKLDDLDILEKFIALWGILATVWGFVERKLRYKEIKKQSINSNRLQLKLDNKKQSSNLQSNGKTQKGD